MIIWALTWPLFHICKLVSVIHFMKIMHFNWETGMNATVAYNDSKRRACKETVNNWWKVLYTFFKDSFWHEKVLCWNFTTTKIWVKKNYVCAMPYVWSEVIQTFNSLPNRQRNASDTWPKVLLSQCNIGAWRLNLFTFVTYCICSYSRNGPVSQTWIKPSPFTLTFGQQV